MKKRLIIVPSLQHLHFTHLLMIIKGYRLCRRPLLNQVLVILCDM